ncbi:MAG TPA: PIN domain-containing protein [Mobilitalea sp.]|nr:PIN domain-containing protein [Mobilitalea sp.]
MRASLDTNVIIHLYRAGQKTILFDRFIEGIYIYEQIRYVEMENHGQDILQELDQDIADGKIQLITRDFLRGQAVLRMFNEYVEENRILYNPGDMGEVYAIALAQTLGAYSLVTDDVKDRGPYDSLLRLNYNDVMPLNFSDVLLLNYLEGILNAGRTVATFNKINERSDLKWGLESQLKKFIRRYWSNPYQETDKEWMADFCITRNIKAKEKFIELRKWLQ